MATKSRYRARKGRDVSVTMTRSRSLHSSASPRAAEPNTIAFLARVKWGARLRFSESRSRMMTVLMTRILPEESPITARSRTDDWAFGGPWVDAPALVPRARRTRGTARRRRRRGGVGAVARASQATMPDGRHARRVAASPRGEPGHRVRPAVRVGRAGRALADQRR